MTKTPIKPSEAKGFILRGTSYTWAGVSKKKKNPRRGQRHAMEYVGTIHDLSVIEQMQYETESGRVTPSGYGPDA